MGLAEKIKDAENGITDNEFLLFDRITKIKSVIEKYGEDNFYISFSGGKDSTVLHYLVDMALPNNRIPRVYANTGIELNMIKDFVYEMQKNDDRIVIIKPSVPIKPTLEKFGYPFKSKKHAKLVGMYHRLGKTQSVQTYLGEKTTRYKKTLEDKSFQCPDKLRFQFDENYNLKISDKCCEKIKEQPLINWAKENKKQYRIIGVMASEGGRRMKAKCMAFRNGKFKNFQPLVAVTKEWEDWFIYNYDVKICCIYKEPYNFVRTGCKGCPFAIDLQNELDTLERYFPNERKQCEIIWEPVYSEYRRLHYRLKPEPMYKQISIDELLKDQ